MTKLTEQNYKSLIDEDLKMIEKFLPENSLEKNHIKVVLINSIEQYYKNDKKIG